MITGGAGSIGSILTKKILESESNKYLECHFNVPESKIEDKWKEGVEFLLKNENWIAVSKNTRWWLPRPLIKPVENQHLPEQIFLCRNTKCRLRKHLIKPVEKHGFREIAKKHNSRHKHKLSAASIPY